MWDMYFQLGDQFLVFFMSLILVFNIREEIMSSQDMEKPELISTLVNTNNWYKQQIIILFWFLIFKELIQSSPASLDADDLYDFNGLCQHFAAKTPQSFRKVR